MKRTIAGPGLVLPGLLRRKTFFYGMTAFLMLPFMPVQFTSILTAVVWIFSGMPYAVVFVVLGTFRVDSVPIYSGIQQILGMMLPPFLAGLSGSIAVTIMFAGNLLTAYAFKTLLFGKFAKRFRRTTA